MSLRRGTLTGGIIRRPPTYPMTHFQEWLLGHGASMSTAVVYSSRIRGVLGAAGAESDELPDIATISNSQEILDAHFHGLSLGLCPQVITAWRSFAAFLVDRGLNPDQIYVPVDGRRRNDPSLTGYRRPQTALQRPPEASQLPERVRQAIWTVLAKGNRPMPPDLLLGLIWRRALAWKGTAPHNALRMDLTDATRAIWYYERPLTAWMVLWEWAAGPDRTAPLWDQPILVAREGVLDRMDPAVVLAIAAQGKRGSIPIFGDPGLYSWRPWSAMVLPIELPPTMPPSPSTSNVQTEKVVSVAEDPLEDWDDDGKE